MSTTNERPTPETDGVVARYLGDEGISAEEVSRLLDHARKLERQRDELRAGVIALSYAYLRLRRKLNAFNTPTAPTPEQIWAHTEARLDEIIKQRDELLAALETALNYMKRDGLASNGPCMLAEHAIAKVKGSK